jgi:hypothetical protein
MKERLQDEWRRLRAATRSLDAQVVVVLVGAVALVFVQLTVGSRGFFHSEVAELLPAEWRGLAGWGWWFGIQGVTGFAIPVLILMLGFGRRPSEIGLGAGDGTLALALAGLYLPLVAAGTWVLSDGAAFQVQYPHYDPAAEDWGVFLIYEALFLFYWIGWEYLWRGFVLFGTAPVFGVYAIFVQMVPFAVLHAQKPPAEAFLSILGGVALGALVWRCRAFWIAVPIHAAQMMILDFWCSLRVRTGADGIGLDALAVALGLAG